MPRQKKDGKYINIYMQRSLVEAVERYSKETMIPKTVILEKAVQEYLKRNNAKAFRSLICPFFAIQP